LDFQLGIEFHSIDECPLTSATMGRSTTHTVIQCSPSVVLVEEKRKVNASNATSVCTCTVLRSITRMLTESYHMLTFVY